MSCWILFTAPAGQRRQEPLEHQAQAAPARRWPAPEGGDAPPASHEPSLAAQLLRLVGARKDAGERASAPAAPAGGSSPRQPGGGLHLAQLRQPAWWCAAVAEPVPVAFSFTDGERKLRDPTAAASSFHWLLRLREAPGGAPRARRQPPRRQPRARRAPQRRGGPRRAGLAPRIYAAAARLPNPPRRHLHHGGGGAQHREDAHGGKAPEKKRRRRLAPSTARRRERGRGERGDRGRIEGPQICGLCPKIWWATNFSHLDSRPVGG